MVDYAQKPKATNLILSSMHYCVIQKSEEKHKTAQG
jgi:hypothetical protein